MTLNTDISELISQLEMFQEHLEQKRDEFEDKIADSVRFIESLKAVKRNMETPANQIARDPVLEQVFVNFFKDEKTPEVVEEDDEDEVVVKEESSKKKRRRGEHLAPLDIPVRKRRCVNLADLYCSE